MNPDTGEIRKFATSSEATAAGFGVGLTIEEEIRLSVLPPDERVVALAKMRASARAASTPHNALHPSGKNRATRRNRR